MYNKEVAINVHFKSGNWSQRIITHIWQHLILACCEKAELCGYKLHAQCNKLSTWKEPNRAFYWFLHQWPKLNGVLLVFSQPFFSELVINVLSCGFIVKFTEKTFCVIDCPLPNLTNSLRQGKSNVINTYTFTS